MKTILKKYWGYESFRSYQEETIHAILGRRDTLTVLPTGGGKSVCFQVPALMMDGMAVVLSPLISLMKDQVDALTEMGIAAAYLNSSLDFREQDEILTRIRAGKLKLLYIAPERLKTPQIQSLLVSSDISFFVIDEAHCISEWGHDFREDYRELKMLKEIAEGANVHAFTATATESVRADILKSLKLSNPHINVAPIDRANLTYRIQPRSSAMRQIVDVLKRHEGEPGIVYCLKRKDVDNVSQELNGLGYENVPYHAGLADAVRKKNHDRFSREAVNVVVATVAFGMGIDRSNIRFIVHASMPKSIEHYQQETGRAGRDGLPSSCYLFHSGADYQTWSYLLRGSKNEACMMEKLSALSQFCTLPQCRHRALVEYFSQKHDGKPCGACDYCLGELEQLDDSLIAAQKILSCVVRVEQRFGADHVARILKGEVSAKIQNFGHEKLSTFGLFQEHSIASLRSLIEQLAGQGYLKREAEHATLFVTESGWKILRNEVTPKLVKPMLTKKKRDEIGWKRKRRDEDQWAGVDQKLFEYLRKKRAELAREKGVPAFIIFGDKSLRDMALLKPITRETFASLYGVGDQKLAAYADIFIETIKGYLQRP